MKQVGFSGGGKKQDDSVNGMSYMSGSFSSSYCTLSSDFFLDFFFGGMSMNWLNNYDRISSWEEKVDKYLWCFY